MVIIWGTRLMGKVDAVPGKYFVATQFGHLYYLPLIPKGTYLVFSQNPNGFNGVLIPFSLKSYLLAWLRWAGVLCFGIMALMTLLEFCDGKGKLFGEGSEYLLLLLTLSLAILMIGAYWIPGIGKASESRMAELDHYFEREHGQVRWV
jgi:hypothetical protein